MNMTKDIRFHLIGGSYIDMDCSEFAGDTLEEFLDEVTYHLLDQEYIRVSNFVIPSKNVLYLECLKPIEQKGKTAVDVFIDRTALGEVIIKSLKKPSLFDW